MEMKFFTENLNSCLCWLQLGSGNLPGTGSNDTVWGRKRNDDQQGRSGHSG